MVAIDQQFGRGQAVEDYAKAIYSLQLRAAGDAISTNALAERCDVTAASVSAMMKKLAERGLVTHEPYHGVRLTNAGERLALKVIRKHRLLELFLVKSLDVPWDQVHREADLLEHHLSDELATMIADKLDQPTHDPHGDPIPTIDGTIDEGHTIALDALQPGDAGTFVRVSDSDPAMLRYLADHEIMPGARFEVIDRQPFGGPLSIRFANSIESLGGRLASAMRVELRTTMDADPLADESGSSSPPA